MNDITICNKCEYYNNNMCGCNSSSFILNLKDNDAFNLNEICTYYRKNNEQI